MSKRKCVFNDDLRQKYPFIKKAKSDCDVLCKKCNSNFSIAHGGRTDIEKHLRTNRNKNAEDAAASSSRIDTFVVKDNSNDRISALEGLWVFHSIKENQSFRYNDCAARIFRQYFQLDTFSCSATKTAAIVKNVIAPLSIQCLKSDLEKCHSLTILTDASNHNSTKVFPFLVRYFDLYEGVKVKILEVQSLDGETSDMIVEYVKSVIKSNALEKKIAAFCADNTNTNFGGINRNGKNNVFHKMKADYPNIIGVGCAAHIVHNALQNACDILPIDVECIVVKIYTFFHRYTVRTEALKKFCETIGLQYRSLLGYTKTRFLALLPALEAVLNIFDALKLYFLEQEKMPRILKDFFADPMAKFWLIFVRNEVQISNCYSITIFDK